MRKYIFILLMASLLMSGQAWSNTVTQRIIQHNKNSAEPDQVLVDEVTSSSLEGSKVLKSVYAPNGRLYVLIGLDEAGTQRLYEAAAEEYQKQNKR